MIRYRHYRNSSRTDIMFKLFDKFDIADSILIDTGASVTTISVGKLIDHGMSMEECKAFINNANILNEKRLLNGEIGIYGTSRAVDSSIPHIPLKIHNVKVGNDIFDDFYIHLLMTEQKCLLLGWDIIMSYRTITNKKDGGFLTNFDKTFFDSRVDLHDDNKCTDKSILLSVLQSI